MFLRRHSVCETPVGKKRWNVQIGGEGRETMYETSRSTGTMKVVFFCLLLFCVILTWFSKCYHFHRNYSMIGPLTLFCRCLFIKKVIGVYGLFNSL